MEKMREYENIEHPFEPVYDSNSEILILGTMPSVKSRQEGFYYGHPQNAFWRILADLFKEERPRTIEEKTALLKRHRIAIWDVLQNCDIIASSDSSIRHEVGTDIPALLRKTSIKRIYANGGRAKEQYDKLIREKAGLDIFQLPSTSPAYASMRYEEKLEAWKIIIAK